MYKIYTQRLNDLNEQARNELVKKIHSLELKYHAQEPSIDDTLGFIFLKREVEMFATIAELESGEIVAYSLFFFEETQSGIVHYRWGTYITEDHRKNGMYKKLLRQSEDFHKEKPVKFLCFKTQNPRVYLTITRWAEEFCNHVEPFPTPAKREISGDVMEVTKHYTVARGLDLFPGNVVYAPHDYGRFSKNVTETHFYDNFLVEEWFKGLFGVENLTQNHPKCIQVVIKL